MAFVRFKKVYNNTYAYNVWKEKNEKGEWKQKSKYLGVVTDMEKKTYEKKRQPVEKQEMQILEYGDSYLITEVTAQLPIVSMLRTVFGEMFETLMALIYHRIIVGGAMCHAEPWYDGNYVNRLFPNANMTSQNISKVLSYLGEESVQRSFFAAYIPLVCKEKSGVVIDSTGLPNEIDMPVTDWGHHNGGTAFETRLILAVDRKSERPLYFRYVAGNIGDVSTLANTIEEMTRNGITTSSTLLDAGYYSETNLRMLFAAKITFLIRMPSNRTVYKDIIAENTDIENPKYAVRYDKRGLFVKENEIDIYGKKGFAYLVLDPERRGREISKIVSSMNEKNTELDKIDFSNCGKMILLSSEKLDTTDVVPLYYTRQIAGKMFGIAKDDLDILPLRTHSEPNFKGFMLLIFISLTIACELKARLGKDVSIEKAIAILKTLKCKVFDETIIPNEVNKKQRLLLEALNVLVPKICGV
jgi:transposase